MSKHVKQGIILKQLCLSQLEKEKGFYVLQVWLFENEWYTVIACLSAK